MTQNPFDALGGGDGGLDLGALLQQAQQMQDDLQAAQARLADATVEGSVAGGAVKVTVSGTGELTGVTISPTVVDDPEELEQNLEEIGDFIVAAYRDAKAKADELANQTLGPLAGGLPGLPGDGPGAGPGPLGFSGSDS
ncbi:YbaB/EbfC family nucleoid-associated protein [Nocardioides sp. HM23]|uniref:YbaB/EbfC family nucleoid-associated protein n=1 Tax=Nocardioides bizhenqiangii TaxID=3095076 RepID=UPI002ACAC96A|nr:YbaB/EbfC family nucleoid-associated protein [Nocardioides sp. HM23]MDZ5622593.1 YbaB/EbfC family nucleoid-associated protein [Nocardioides sp. HM23]